MRLAFAILGGAMAAGAFGQTGQGFDTIEARVGRAEAVYRGKIADVSGKGEFDPVRAVFRVDETIKGFSKGRIALSSGELLGDAPLSHYRAWASRGTTFLLSVRQPKPGDGEPPFRLLRLDPPIPEEKGYSNDSDGGLVAMDLSVLRTPAAILGRARRFAQRHPGVTNEALIEIPGSLAARYGSQGDWNGIVIPKVPEVEPLLREDRLRRPVRQHEVDARAPRPEREAAHRARSDAPKQGVCRSRP